MQADVTLIRIVFVAALVSAGYFLKPFPKPGSGNALISAIIGGVLAVSIILFETRIRKATLKTLIGGAVGSILGIAGATLICWIIAATACDPRRVQIFPYTHADVVHGICGIDSRRSQR